MNEITSEAQNELDQKYRSTVLIISAQIFFTFVLTAAAWFLVPESSMAGNDLTPLWVLIIFIAIGSFVVRRVLNRWERFRDAKLLKGEKGVFSTLQMNAVILGAFGELITVVGFAAVVMGGDRFDMLRAAAVALVVFAMNFPRKSMWKMVAQNLSEV